MAFRHFLEKAEWRNDAFRYFPPLSAAFRHFPPFRLFQDPDAELSKYVDGGKKYQSFVCNIVFLAR